MMVMLFVYIYYYLVGCINTVSNEKNILLPPYLTNEIKLTFLKKSEKMGFESIEFYSGQSSGLYTNDSQTLKDLELCLTSCCNSDNKFKKLALKTLMSYSLSNGSLTTLLSIIKILLEDKYDLNGEEQEIYTKNLKLLSISLDNNYTIFDKKSEKDVVFQAALSADDVKISSDGKIVKSTSDAKTVLLYNIFSMH